MMGSCDGGGRESHRAGLTPLNITLSLIFALAQGHVSSSISNTGMRVPVWLHAECAHSEVIEVIREAVPLRRAVKIKAEI